MQLREAFGGSKSKTLHRLTTVYKQTGVVATLSPIGNSKAKVADESFHESVVWHPRLMYFEVRKICWCVRSTRNANPQTAPCAVDPEGMAWHGREIMQTLQPAAARRHVFSANEAKLVSLFNIAAWYARTLCGPTLPARTASSVLGGGLGCVGREADGEAEGESQAERFREWALGSQCRSGTWKKMGL